MIKPRKIAVSFLVLFLSLFVFQKAYASNFGMRPAFPRSENPRTESIFIQTINPGDTVEEGVKIISSANETKNLLLYANDSQKSSGGGFACRQLSDIPLDVGAWISFDLSKLESDKEKIRFGKIKNTIEIEIPPANEVIIPFQIKPPANASVGEHNGCILLQEIKDKSENAGVSLSLRSGIRVAVNIPGEIRKELSLNIFKIEKRNGKIYLMPSIKNTGNVSVDTDVRVDVKYFFGKKHKTFGGEFPVLRDEIYDFNFELKKPFWGLLYSAKATFSYDAGISGMLGVASSDNKTELKSNTVWFFSFPTMLALAVEILIILFLVFLFAIWRLRKKKKKWIKTWEPYTIKNGETLASLSKKFRLHWELIAEVNKIPAPFILKDGDIIKMPPSKRK